MLPASLTLTPPGMDWRYDEISTPTAKIKRWLLFDYEHDGHAGRRYGISLEALESPEGQEHVQAALHYMDPEWAEADWPGEMW